MARRTLVDFIGPLGECDKVVDVYGPIGPPVTDREGNTAPAMELLTPPDWHCRIEQATVRALERVAAGSVLTSASHILRGPFHAGITENAELMFEGRLFYVRGVVDPEERHIATIALCEELR